jgi:hypothetical protein
MTDTPCGYCGKPSGRKVVGAFVCLACVGEIERLRRDPAFLFQVEAATAALRRLAEGSPEAATTPR